jgi:hypothetical protein
MRPASRNYWAGFRCGVDAGFFAGFSLTFLPPIDISVSFWPESDLRGLLDAFEAFAGSAPTTLRRSASTRSTTLPRAG